MQLLTTNASDFVGRRSVDLRNKFERLGIKRSVAYTEQGASTVVRYVSAVGELSRVYLLRSADGVYVSACSHAQIRG